MRLGFSLLAIIAFTFFASSRPLVGINYFAGWWTGPGDKWKQPWNQSVDWRPLYPERVPLCGPYNTQETMDCEIAAASRYGVDYFQILWYNNYPERAPGSRFLNQGVDFFLNSANAHLMKFFISWCNALPLFGLHNDTEWERIIQHDWLPAFRHPSYLRIDDRLVFKVHNGQALLQNCSNSSDIVTKRWTRLRNVVRQNGLGELVIGAGAGVRYNDKPKDWGYEYDFTNLYCGVANDDPSYKGKVLPWSNQSNFIREWRIKHAKSASSSQAYTYVPHIVSGWDPRPWAERRASYIFPTQLEWENELKMIASDFQNFPLMGFPRKDGSIQSAFNIYAWNEFGEGGIMAPSKGWNTSRLEAIEIVFPRDPASKLQHTINRAIHNGLSEVKIAPGDYNFSSTSLYICGANNMSILGAGPGVTNLWFSPGKGVEILDSMNVTIGGFTMDSHEPVFTQGSLLAINLTANTFDIEVMDGFPVPDPSLSWIFNESYENKIIYWDSSSRIMVQGQQMNNPMKKAERIPASSSSVASGVVYRVTPVLPIQPNSGAKIGNLVTISPRVFSSANPIPTFYKGTYFVGNSTHITTLDIHIHSSATMTILEWGGSGRHIYQDVRIERRQHPRMYLPPLTTHPVEKFSAPLLATNSDGLHSFSVEHGPLVQNCSFSFLADDFFNVHNRVLLVGAIQQNSTAAYIIDTGDTLGHDLSVTHTAPQIIIGDELELYQANSRHLIAKLVVSSSVEITDSHLIPSTEKIHDAAKANGVILVGIEQKSLRMFQFNFTSTLPSETLPFATFVQFNRYSGRGAIIRQSNFTDSYNNFGRIAASNLVFENNVVKRCGDGAHIEFLQPFLEGSLGIKNITIRENLFVDIRGCGPGRSGTQPCPTICNNNNISCVLAHVDNELEQQIHTSGNTVIKT